MIKTKKDMSNNEFYTFEEHIKPLVELLEKMNVKKIWCPADTEQSNFVKVFEDAGFVVFHTHINNGEDFFKYKPKFDFDIMITNPPYDVKREWISKAIEYNKPWIFLLPQPVLMNKITKMNAYKINYIYFSKRINYFTPEGKIVSPADTLYVTYDLKINNTCINVDTWEMEGVEIYDKK